MTTVLVTGASAGFGEPVDCLVNNAGLALGLAQVTRAVLPGMCGGTEFSTVRIAWACGPPAHVNVNLIELMPVAQSFAAFQVHRR